MWISNSRSDSSRRGCLPDESAIDPQSRRLDLCRALTPQRSIPPRPYFELGIDLELQEPNQPQIHSSPPIRSSNPNPHQASIQPGAPNRPRSNKITGQNTGSDGSLPIRILYIAYKVRILRSYGCHLTISLVKLG